MSRERFYVTVARETLWTGGNAGAGAWLFPGDTYDLCADDLAALKRAHPDLELTIESTAEHHEKSRAAAAAEKGGE